MLLAANAGYGWLLRDEVASSSAGSRQDSRDESLRVLMKISMGVL